MSNAFHIEGAVFEIAHSFLWQSGICLWPPQSDQTDFQSSTTLLFHGADSGHIHHNTLLWQCSAYDMDVSSRILFEDNVVTETQSGVFPHGFAKMGSASTRAELMHSVSCMCNAETRSHFTTGPLILRLR